MEITHIHPMLVHFPLVLWLAGTLFMLWQATAGANVSECNFVGKAAFWSLALGTAFGVAAAIFGDIALDAAKAAGFPEAALESHEEAALAALWIFVAATAAYGWSFFRRQAVPGWLDKGVLALCLAGLGAVLYAAFLGGSLVYVLGVNVMTAS